MDRQVQEKRSVQTRRLQQSLSSIRKIAGWTAEELGDRIGVTKQTISNLENNKTEMSFTQYIAIRAVLDCEMAEHPENELLPKVVKILLDQDESELSPQDYEKLKTSVDTVAAAAAGGASGEALEATFSSLVTPTLAGAGISLLTPLGLSLAAGAVAGGIWLRNILAKSKKNQKAGAEQSAAPSHGAEDGQSAAPGQGAEDGQSAAPGHGAADGRSAAPGHGAADGRSAAPGQGVEDGQSAAPGQSVEDGRSAAPGQSIGGE